MRIQLLCHTPIPEVFQISRELERRRAMLALVASLPNEPRVRRFLPGDTDKATAFVQRCQRVFLSSGRSARTS